MGWRGRVRGWANEERRELVREGGKEGQMHFCILFSAKRCKSTFPHTVTNNGKSGRGTKVARRTCRGHRK